MSILKVGSVETKLTIKHLYHSRNGSSAVWLRSAAFPFLRSSVTTTVQTPCRSVSLTPTAVTKPYQNFSFLVSFCFVFWFSGFLVFWFFLFF